MIVLTKGGPGSGSKIRNAHGQYGSYGAGEGPAPKAKYSPGQAPPHTIDQMDSFDWNTNGYGSNWINMHVFVDEPQVKDFQGWTFSDEGVRGNVKNYIVTSISDKTGIEYETVNKMIHQWANTSNDTSYASLSLQQAAAQELGVKLSPWQQGKINAWMEKGGKYITPEMDKIAQEREDFRRANVRQLATYPYMEATWDKAHPEPGHSWSDILLYERQTAGLDRPITTRENERAVIREMYNMTQDRFKGAGSDPDNDTITLFRGVSLKRSLGEDLENGDTANYKGNAIESWSASDRVANGFMGNYIDGYKGTRYDYVLAMDVPIKNIVGTCRTGFGCLNEAEFVVLGNVPGQQVMIKSWREHRQY